ncbi:uncharacterized protein LOC110462653 [Mizuhopecten yessoensis]|uniref:Mitochondria-eating protein C-terminal domain-containing protein n=1 Tax=Mizuhopecten yessoensis TaxID=6573 RepID=A0A210PXT6_MIZYE|nr:uncharacterized protein LOC110462653 [Mizuhopecten yessoensis]OWF41297.1 hypothetical protein KP79_PYT13134 [Mizuhopecten yessoensis]
MDDQPPAIHPQEAEVPIPVAHEAASDGGYADTPGHLKPREPVYRDNIRPSPSPDNDHSELPAIHQPHAEVRIPVAQKKASDKYGVYADIPGHMKFRLDRGKRRSDLEFKSVFVFKHDDNRSVDVPRVLRLVCAYRVGLQIVRQQLQIVDSSSGVPMETDASETEPSELFDDNASDADYIWCGMTSKEYQERLNSAKETAKIYSWMEIYEQFIGECCNEEESLAKTVQQLRNDPDGDVKYFCRDNLITHTKDMIKRWKLLNAVAMQLHSEMETLNRSAYPCMEVYSDIELHYGAGEYLQRLKATGQSTIPDKWKKISEKNSDLIRQIKTEVSCTIKKLHDRILTNLMEMDATRKVNYIKLCSRYTGLTAIVSKLNNILSNICRGEQVLHESFTEEETWYNEFDYSYVDMYFKNANVKGDSETEWNRAAKQTRHNLATKIVEWCTTLHQQYGALVKELRTQRKSVRPGIKTHVAELETRVVQQQSQMTKMENEFKTKEALWFEKDLRTQQTNADLTSQLDDVKYNADYLKKQINTQWNQYLVQLTDEQSRKFETQQAKLAEAMNKMAALRREKENLLTRLSKIAGSKLVHGNPAITDLSDANRPTKLSERYSELYDNEWTDALEELIDRKDIVQGEDVVCTKILPAILIESFKFCCETEAEYVRTIRQSLTSLPGSNPDRTEQEQKEAVGTCTTMTHEQTQQLDDLVKTCVPMLTSAVESKFLTLMEKQFAHVIKLAGGSIKSDSQMPRSDQMLLTQMHAPEMTTRTDVQSTTQDNADYGRNQPSTLEESDPTKNRTPADEQATSQTGTSPSDQEPNDHLATESHRQFSHGHSDDMSDQGNQQNENTWHDSHTTDTTGYARISSLEKTIKFTKCCVNLCWLMRIKNPPLHMDTELVEDSDINTDFYKNYTHKGKKVGYLVWPALFLHKGGPLLCKGIVQPLSKKKDKNT